MKTYQHKVSYMQITDAVTKPCRRLAKFPCHSHRLPYYKYESENVAKTPKQHRALSHSR